MVHPDILTGRLGNRLFQIAYLYSQVKEGNIPDWYLQDVKYFEKYGDEIKKLFGEGIGYLPYVAVHLRVGANPLLPSEPKYSENPFYVRLIETGYYIEALKLFPNRKFLVFSDDNDFARKYFEGDIFAFDESQTDIEALNKMASCDGHIIANSSFSWWGAYLSPHNGKVVFPKNWFSGKIQRVGCPETWTQL